MRLRMFRLGRWIKRQLPTSLFGRSLLIIVLPIALMQVAVTYVFFDAHWKTVTSRLSEGLAGDIAWAVESYKEDPSPESLARLTQTRRADILDLGDAQRLVLECHVVLRGRLGGHLQFDDVRSGGRGRRR